jgi:hypothetical protein
MGEDGGDRLVLCIDVGVLNMAFVVMRIDSLYRSTGVVHAVKENITKCVDPTCRLTCCDDRLLRFRNSVQVRHFLEKHRAWFERSPILLAEQQPPMGLLVIQELLLYEFPEMLLVSPRSMHAFYGIGHLDYDHRKVAVGEIAESALAKFAAFQEHERVHDMADAYCLARCWLHKKEVKERERVSNQEHAKLHHLAIAGFNAFRYTATD